MGLMYSASFEGSAQTAQVDWFEILAPTDAVVVIHRIKISQETEVADAEAEMLRYNLVRGEGTVTSGSGGSTATPSALSSGAPAAGTVVETNNTTKMVVGTGTLVLMEAGAFHVAAGLDYAPTPEERISVSPGDRLTVELATTPADSITFNGTVVFEEIGG